MNTTVALRHRTLAALFTGTAAFTGTFLVLFAFVWALAGSEQLRQPVVFGLAGPSVASELLRPGLVIAGTMAVAATLICSRGVPRRINHSAAASIVIDDGALDIHGLWDWPNVGFDDHGADAAGRDDTKKYKPGNTPQRSETPLDPGPA